MGNRAAVVFESDGNFSPVVYLHWNGGPESVWAFLAELDRRGIREDADYEAARFIHVVGDFFDNEKTTGLSLGVLNLPKGFPKPGALKILDPGDNGIYIINRKDRKITRFRYGNTHTAEEVAEEFKAAMAHDYNKSDGIPATFLKARPKVETENYKEAARKPWPWEARDAQ